MSHTHLVLARRYRPRVFGDLVGQEQTVRMIQNALRAGRLGHAFLFHGVRGVGKTTLARLLARVVNCTSLIASEQYEPCNTCESCCAILEDRHIDVIEMDAASHTSVDDIRPLIDAAPYRPQLARYKIYMIDEVHMLSKSAFNALLKTLEEPPPHVKFIFATTEIRRLPATILSRCLRFDLRRVPLDVLVKHFRNILSQEKIQMEDEALMLVARASDGSVRDGLSLLDPIIASESQMITASEVRHLLGLSDAHDMIKLMEDLVHGRLAPAYQRLELLYAAGLDHATVIQECLVMVHHLTQRKLHLVLPGETPYPSDVLDHWVPDLSLTWLMRVWQILIKALDDLKASVRPEYVLEMTFAKCVFIQDEQNQTPQKIPDIKTQPSVEGHFAMISSEQTDNAQSVFIAPITDTALPLSFEDVVFLFEHHKEMILASHLRQDVELVMYEPGSMTLCLRSQAPIDLINRVAKHLQLWTGYAWHITASKTRGHPSLVEQAKQKDQDALTTGLQHPIAQVIQKTFPDTKVGWHSDR